VSDDSLEALIAGMWQRLAPEQRANAQRLCVALAEVRTQLGAGEDPRAWAEVRELAHRLAGSLGSLGQHAAGREAVAMEDLTSGVEQPDDELLLRVTAHASALLDRLARGAPEEPPSDGDAPPPARW